MAFSKESRQEILNRAHGMSEQHAVGYDFGYVECSHIDHDRNSDLYDDPSNGQALTPVQHYLIHELGADKDFMYNPQAANLLWGRLTEDQRAYLAYLESIG